MTTNLTEFNLNLLTTSVLGDGICIDYVLLRLDNSKYLNVQKFSRHMIMQGDVR
jgi:hypothetical protein